MNAAYRTLAARFARIHTIAEAQAMLNRDAAAMMPRLTWAGVRTPPMPYRLLELAEVHA